ncbi:MAG TPA: phosphatase PAP2-related protein [Bacteroidia bacterium]|nr:phosphatase PAP2-related protein [Bacteroidia bacterium]
MKNAWQLYFSRPNKRAIFLFTLGILAITLISFVYFLTFNENRIGYVFDDPILNLFEPIAISEITFFITYFFAIYGIIISFREPALFVSLLQAYTIMTLLRMFCLYVVPLEAPVSIIPLKDTFLQSTFYSGRENLKDLFFSGHAATIFLFAFAFRKKGTKWLFFIGACAVGVLVVIQHVHFSIDVIAAPVFAFIAISIQKKVRLN